MTVKSILGDKSLNSSNDDDFSEPLLNNDKSFEDARLTKTNFTVEDKEKLINAVTEETMNSDLINWQSIAENEFKGAFSAQDCIYEFMKLPISESLNLNTESNQEDAKPFD